MIAASVSGERKSPFLSSEGFYRDFGKGVCAPARLLGQGRISVSSYHNLLIVIEHRDVFATVNLTSVLNPEASKI